MIELAEFVTERTVEKAYEKACSAMKHGDQAFARKGMFAARARDDRLLKALERGAEVIHAIAERQQGRTTRSLDTQYSHRTWPTEATLWREAYKFCDQGNPLENFCWIYGAAALLAGY